MAVANLGAHTKGLVKVVDGNPVQSLGAQGLGKKIVRAADHNLAPIAADLQHIERRTGGYAETLALADGEVVDSLVGADDLTAGGNELAGGVGDGFALLLE